MTSRCMLKRHMACSNQEATGLQTPPETESEGGSGRSEDGDESIRSEDIDPQRQEESEIFISQALEEVELD